MGELIHMFEDEGVMEEVALWRTGQTQPEQESFYDLATQFYELEKIREPDDDEAYEAGRETIGRKGLDMQLDISDIIDAYNLAIARIHQEQKNEEGS